MSTLTLRVSRDARSALTSIIRTKFFSGNDREFWRAKRRFDEVLQRQREEEIRLQYWQEKQHREERARQQQRQCRLDECRFHQTLPWLEDEAPMPGHSSSNEGFRTLLSAHVEEFDPKRYGAWGDPPRRRWLWKKKRHGHGPRPPQKQLRKWEAELSCPRFRRKYVEARWTHLTEK